MNQPLVRGHDAKAPALGDVEAGEVEPVQVQHAAVDDHHLAVIAHQIVGGARHRDAAVEQLHFELAQALLAAAIGVGDQGPHADASRHRGSQRVGHVAAIEPEDHDVEALLGLLDGGQDRGNAGFRLHDDFH